MALISTFGQAGLCVPEDVSVMGYDDAVFASHTSPPLTTVRIPMESMAINGCRHLLNLCYGLSLPVQREFHPSVVWRHSVGDGPHARQPLDIPSVA
jgi:LacI family transcriptional regulator